MGWQATMEAIAAGTGASVTVAALARRWFRAAVRDVVKEEMRNVMKEGLRDVVKRQRDVITHLDEQDHRLERIEQRLNRR